MMAVAASTLGTWRLDALLDGFSSAAASCSPLPVAHLTLDSRRVVDGTLFFACQGERLHGLTFARDVAARGAVAIAAEPSPDWPREAIVQLAADLHLDIVPVDQLTAKVGAIAARFYQYPGAELEMIGITGTNGKTSVSHFVAQGLAVQTHCGVIGTLGEGFPGALVSTGMTTPDPVSLQASLAALRHQGAAAVAMEVSSHALAQHRVDAVRFDYAVLTNLTRDHLDYHGDMAAYGEAKARLFQAADLRWIILNADDPFSQQLVSSLPTGPRVALYSLDPDFAPRGALQTRCDLWLRARQIKLDDQGLHLIAESGADGSGAESQSGELTTSLIGRFNAANLLAALSVLIARGSDLSTALRQLAGISGVPGRMECFNQPGEPLCVVDYAHTPDALEQALEELRRHSRGRVIVVFGCGGERDRGKRALMGEVAARLADQVILTDDNPRHEDGDAIIADIQSGMSGSTQVLVERQRGVAIRRGLLLAARGDALLVAGKGHETEQDMGELKVRFSDRAQLLQALRERRGVE